MSIQFDGIKEHMSEMLTKGAFTMIERSDGCNMFKSDLPTDTCFCFIAQVSLALAAV